MTPVGNITMLRPIWKETRKFLAYGKTGQSPHSF